MLCKDISKGGRNWTKYSKRVEFLITVSHKNECFHTSRIKKGGSKVLWVRCEGMAKR